LKFNYDPLLIDNELCEDIKMIHFTSDFSCNQQDNCISNHNWIKDIWID